MDGGRGNSFIKISLLFPSINVFSNVVVSEARGCSCDMNIVAFAFVDSCVFGGCVGDVDEFFIVSVTSSGLDNVLGCGVGGDFFLRTLHRVMIIAMLVANATKENEKYRNETIDELLLPLA